MSQIAYDPVKDNFAGLIRRSRVLRSLFYSLLDLFFLRSWYIRSRLRSWYGREVVQVEKSDSRLCILDAGCGFGQYDRFMLHAFPGTRIDAVDVKQDYLQDCTHFFRGDIDAGQITFTQMDLLSPSLSKSYHLVLCVDVLEHIVEDVRVMRNMQQSSQTRRVFSHAFPPRIWLRTMQMVMRVLLANMHGRDIAAKSCQINFVLPDLNLSISGIPMAGLVTQPG